MPRTDIIDISHWQDDVDFAELARTSLCGVIHKCTEGTSYLDPRYAERKDEARQLGIPFAAYHFLKHGNATKQMDWFVKQAGLPAGSRMVIDYEDTACTLDDLREAIEVLSAGEVYEVCVYCGGHLKGQVKQGVAYPWLSATSLWIAHYAKEPTWPGWIWPAYSLWQWADNGDVLGVQGPCDVNEFNGSPDNCIRWMGPVEEDEVDARIVTIRLNVEAPDGIVVRVMINGEEV